MKTISPKDLRKIYKWAAENEHKNELAEGALVVRKLCSGFTDDFPPLKIKKRGLYARNLLERTILRRYL